VTNASATSSQRVFPDTPQCILGFALRLEKPDRLVVPTARKHIEPHDHKIPRDSEVGIRRNYLRG